VWEATPAGPFDRRPIGLGFQYFYGFVGGDASQWQPNLFRNTAAVEPYLGHPGWNLVTAMADNAIRYLRELNAISPDRPFLVYYAPGATHAPAPSNARVDRAVQGQVRHGLERSA
jgi:arylsulfatase